MPGVAGNIASGDTVNTLEEIRIGTGINLVKLIKYERVVQDLISKQLPGEVIKSGSASWAPRIPR